MATPLVFESFWRDRGAIAGSQKFRKEIDATHSSVTKLGAASSKFGGLGGLAFKAAGAAAVGFGLKVASGNEQARISFTTMLGSAQKADVFLRKLQQFAATTPFEFPELQTAASSLISAGINADKVIPIMRNLGDVTAGMGTGSEGIRRATIALQQMNAAGRITGEDLNQLRDAGVPVYDLLAAATGKSKEEVVKLAQAGKLGRRELGQMMAALESGKGLERFSGLMEKQAQSLAGMVSTLKDNVGQGLADLLTPVFPAIKAGLGAFNDLGSGAKATFAVVAGGAVAFGLAAKGALGLASSFRTLGVSASAARIATGGVGAALGIATLAFGLYAKTHAEAKARVADFTQALQSETAAVKQNVTAVAAKQLQDAGAFRAAQQLGLGLDLVTRAALGEQDALAQVNAVIDHYTQAGLNSADVDANVRVGAANDLGRAIGQTSDAYNGATAEAKQMAAATATTGGSMATAAVKTEDLGKKQRDLRIKLIEAKTAMQGLLDKMTILKTGSLDLEQANIAWEEAIDGVTQSAKDNGRSLSDNTEKGRANRTAIINAMRALNDKTVADFKGAAQSRNSAKATKEASERYRENRERLVRTALAAGYSREEVRKMIGQYLKTPKKLETDVKADTKKAREDIRKLREAIALVKSREAWIKFSTNADEVRKKYGVSLATFRGSTAAQGGPRARGGILPGQTPLSRGDDIAFPMANGGIQPLRGGEGIAVTEAMRDPYERARLLAVNKAALAGQSLERFQRGLAEGGVVRRSLNVRTEKPGVGWVRPVFDEIGGRLARQVANRLAAAMAAKLSSAVGSGLIGGGGFARALAWARTQEGKPYQYPMVGPRSYDCSGWISALQNYVRGRPVHRRVFSTGMFQGGPSRMAGWTRNKSSPFMIGVIPTGETSARLGHVAGTLNGVNVEASSGVGVRVGPEARGWRNGLFKYRYGLARGGLVGDLPFDALDPRGERYNPYLREFYEQVLRRGAPAGLRTGGVVTQPGYARLAERGPERVLSTRQNDSFERLVRVMDRGRAGNVYHVTINAPNYVGSRDELREAMLQMVRTNRFQVLTR